MMSKLYKLIFDISVCYTIGAFLLSYYGGITLSGEGFLILLTTAFVSSLLNQKRNFTIFITILASGGFLVFYLPSIPELIVFVLILVYYLAMVITERFLVSHGKFLDIIKYFLYGCFLLPFLMILAFQDFKTAMQAASPYLIMALVSAVFLLRHLRVVNPMEEMKLYRRQQLLELLGFLVICLLVTFARVPQNLMEGFKLLYQYLLIPIISLLGSFVAVVIGGIIYLIMSALSSVINNKEIEGAKVYVANTVDKYSDISDIRIANIEWIIPLLYSIGAMIAMVLLVLFFRRLMGEKLKQKVPTGIHETREYLEDVKDRKAPLRKGHRNDKRAIVRYYYGKSLLWLQHKGIQLIAQDTTEEIHHKYDSLPTDHLDERKEASAQLMKIYRKARYHTKEEITKDDAEKAKALYQNIRKK